MSRWLCGIGGCEAAFDDPESAIVHQTADHQRHECKVCGTVVPDGYFAIRHAFEEHTRAEYVRAYDADADEVRERERIKERIEANADLEAVAERIDETL
jgi:predicted  nucleic acid-binding Zn-ribbon protein